MSVKGFQGTSLLDYPGRLASLVFFGGCNLRCPYCHNPSLVEGFEALPDYPPEALLANLEGRKGFVDGVVISGGEPTLSEDLMPLLRRIKALGFSLKLDSNGLRPDVLEECVAEGLIDYLALDFKTSVSRYPELGAGRGAAGALERSLGLLRDGAVQGEVRTTCMPTLVEEADIEAMGRLLDGHRFWVLQGFVPHHALEAGARELAAPTRARMEQLARLASVHVRTVKLRGI